MTTKHRKILYWSASVVSFLAIGIWFFVFKDHVYTDDAYVHGNLVMITPLQPGFVQAVLTDDTFLVHKGQLLVELDSTDAAIALESAKELLGLKVREISGTFHAWFALQAEIQAKKADFLQAAQDYTHRLSVLAIGGVSVEEFEHAEAALKRTFFLLRQTERTYKRLSAFLQGTSISTHPEVIQAKDKARQAFVNLYRTRIYSPVDGLVAQRNIQVGSWIPAGTPMLAVIPLDQIWVNANFKETQMKHMRIGQHVVMTSDLYGKDVVFHGTIVGLPGGSGNVFSLLPPQNLSGNWIKIVQRLPVRVAIDQNALKEHPLRLGLSMEAFVDLRTAGVLVPSSSEGAPKYTTDIYEQEEYGDMIWIEEIMKIHSDPTLLPYFTEPLIIQ